MTTLHRTLAEAVREALATDPATTFLGDDAWPVADRGTLGVALGLALAGKRPVVELAGTARLPAVVEVLAEAGAVAAKGEFAVPLVVRVPYGTEARGLDQPVGRWLADLPATTVVCASSPAVGAGLARWALSQRAPVVILEPRAHADERGPVGDEVVPPAARVVRQGAHVVLAAWGAGVGAAVEAADALGQQGFEAAVLDLVALQPLDARAIGEQVRRTGRLVVVHDGDPALARHVREAALDEAFLFLEAPLAAASGGDVVRTALDAVRY